MADFRILKFSNTVEGDGEMKFKWGLIGLFVLMMAGCNESITGKVVDSETGEPIEGAVILVEWTQTKGVPGMSYAESYKVVEAVTNNEGKASIDGVFSPFIEGPCLTIYKKGYVAWNNKLIFPGWDKRTDFEWKNNYVFKLERFKPEYSYVKHTSFIRNAIHSHDVSQKKLLIKKSYRWEEIEASLEMTKTGEK